MTEPTTPAEPTTAPAEPDPGTVQQEPAADPPQTAPDEPLGEGGKKALQAEREARRAAEKAAQEAAERIREFEDRDKTELQKAQDAAAEADKRAVDAWREALTTAHQISEDDAAVFLTGSDAETLKRQAARLVELRGAQAPAPAAQPSQRTPVENLRPGQVPEPPEPTVADQIAAAEKAGDWQTARRLKTQQMLTKK